jgi:hypothetical protein
MPVCEGPGCSPGGRYVEYRFHEWRCDNGSLLDVNGEAFDPILTGDRFCELCGLQPGSAPQQQKCAHSGCCTGVKRTQDLPNGYLCNCTPGRSGKHCTVSDPCLVSLPCQNGARCTPVTNVSRGYTCSCPLGVSGVNCTDLTTVWNSLCCTFSCAPDPGSGVSVDRRFCSVFTVWTAIFNILIAILVAAAYFGVYYRLLRTQALPSTCSVAVRCSCGVAAACALAFVLRHVALRSDLGWELKLLLAMLAAVVEVGIAALWRHCRRLGHPQNTISNRLLRGVGVPLLATVAVSPVLVFGATSSDNLQQHAGCVAFGCTEYWWRVISFGVIAPSLPVAVLVAQTYISEEERSRATAPMRTTMAKYEVHRADSFVRAQYLYTILSGLLFPAFWIAYMRNEMQIFAEAMRRLQTAPIDTSVSVDGVRALGPVTVLLNSLLIIALAIALASFPAVQVWSPMVFFGIAWCAGVIVLMTASTCCLIWALSEPSENAVERQNKAMNSARTQMLQASFRSRRVISQRPKLMAVFEFFTSWQGQTVLSTVNHLVAIALFAYGLTQFEQHLTAALSLWMKAGISMSCAGLVISGLSLLERKFPRFKITPTDDSFRLACLLKTALVMSKAMIVFLLANVDNKSESFSHWETVIGIICVSSVVILAMMTLAFAVRKVWQRPRLLRTVGVASPRLFIVQYGISYMCAKCATLLFMANGHIPDLVGCTEDEIHFEQKQPSNDPSTTCVLCYPEPLYYQEQLNLTSATTEVGASCRPSTELYYNCTTSCRHLFFSGGGNADQNLVVFVLAPLLWLPFAVYSNNEVAQLIDGLWWQHVQLTDTVAGRTSSPQHLKIGLATSVHGYDTISPLVHAVTLGCGAIVLLLLCKGQHWGYHVDAPPCSLRSCGQMDEHSDPPQLQPGPDGEGLQTALDKAGKAVTWATVVLNMVMVCRVILDIYSHVRQQHHHHDELVSDRGTPLLARLSRDGSNSAARAHHLLPKDGESDEALGAAVAVAVEASEEVEAPTTDGGYGGSE